jgi:hypothetical protein
VVFSVSDDGTTFTRVGVVAHSIDPASRKTIIHDFSLEHPLNTRYLKIHAKNMGQCPPWHPGAGDKAWIFCDEIIVE